MASDLVSTIKALRTKFLSMTRKTVEEEDNLKELRRIQMLCATGSRVAQRDFAIFLRDLSCQYGYHREYYSNKLKARQKKEKKKGILGGEEVELNSKKVGAEDVVTKTESQSAKNQAAESVKSSLDYVRAKYLDPSLTSEFTAEELDELHRIRESIRSVTTRKGLTKFHALCRQISEHRGMKAQALFERLTQIREREKNNPDRINSEVILKMKEFRNRTMPTVKDRTLNVEELTELARFREQSLPSNAMRTVYTSLCKDLSKEMGKHPQFVYELITKHRARTVSLAVKKEQMEKRAKAELIRLKSEIPPGDVTSLDEARQKFLQSAEIQALSKENLDELNRILDICKLTSDSKQFFDFCKELSKKLGIQKNGVRTQLFLRRIQIQDDKENVPSDPSRKSCGKSGKDQQNDAKRQTMMEKIPKAMAEELECLREKFFSMEQNEAFSKENFSDLIKIKNRYEQHSNMAIRAFSLFCKDVSEYFLFNDEYVRAKITIYEKELNGSEKNDSTGEMESQQQSTPLPEFTSASEALKYMEKKYMDPSHGHTVTKEEWNEFFIISKICVNESKSAYLKFLKVSKKISRLFGRHEECISVHSRHMRQRENAEKSAKMAEKLRSELPPGVPSTVGQARAKYLENENFKMKDKDWDDLWRLREISLLAANKEPSHFYALCKELSNKMGECDEFVRLELCRRNKSGSFKRSLPKRQKTIKEAFSKNSRNNEAEENPSSVNDFSEEDEPESDSSFSLSDIGSSSDENDENAMETESVFDKTMESEAQNNSLQYDVSEQVDALNTETERSTENYSRSLRTGPEAETEQLSGSIMETKPSIVAEKRVQMVLDDLRILRPSWEEKEFKCAQKWLEIASNGPNVADENFSLISAALVACKKADDIFQIHGDLLRPALTHHLKSALMKR